MTDFLNFFTQYLSETQSCFTKADNLLMYSKCTSNVVWGPFVLILLFGLGIYLSIGLRGINILWLPKTFKWLWQGRTSQSNDGDITPFQSLMTALSSTVGTGNIAGVGIALAVGGPGAIFWMWVTAIIGMSTKFSESLLGVHFRETTPDGRRVGGPMYYIKNGLGKYWLWLAFVFAFIGSITAFGIGNAVQANEVTNALFSVFKLKNAPDTEIYRWLIGGIMACLVGAVILGGIARIGRITEKMVPLMAILYVGSALIILIIHADSLPKAFATIFDGAFNGTAATGGFIGAAVQKAIQMGVSRGVFSNESGMGSAPIAHAAAKTDNPLQQAGIAMLGTFIDTLIICTMTALVIIVSGQWNSGLSGSPLSAAAFASGIKYGDVIVAISLATFALTTLIGWSYYGERCVEFLLGRSAIIPYRVLWVIVIPLGAYQKQDLIWSLADIMNGLMIIPNLIAVALLSPVVFKLVRQERKH